MSQSNGSAIPTILPERTVFAVLMHQPLLWANGRTPEQVHTALVRCHIPPEAPWEHWCDVVERAQYLGVSA